MARSSTALAVFTAAVACGRPHGAEVADWVRGQHDAQCRAGAAPLLLVYNRIDKCGSTTVSKWMERRVAGRAVWCRDMRHNIHRYRWLADEEQPSFALRTYDNCAACGRPYAPGEEAHICLLYTSPSPRD